MRWIVITAGIVWRKHTDAVAEGQGEKAEDALAALEASYAKDVTDEFVVPTVIDRRTENRLQR